MLSPSPDAIARVALGVMARAPIPGRCKTRLAPHLGAEGAAALYAAMLRDTLHACARVPAGRHVILAAPEDDGVAALGVLAVSARAECGQWEVVAQSGADLGERLTRAATTLGHAGHAVVLVGSDAPAAPFEALLRASTHLATPDRALLGPSDDGGYWLIGLGAPNAGVFERIAWSTGTVLAETRRRCAELGLVTRDLPAAYDVDEAADVERLRADLRRAPELAPHTAHLLSGGHARRSTPFASALSARRPRT
jgi:rSAM/selenodomain-associated transferase 1